jgi:HJR/Mrr/RecB family endonuclease
MGAQEGVVVTNNYFTEDAIKLANSNNITLINRGGLSKLIEYTQTNSDEIIMRRDR